MSHQIFISYASEDQDRIQPLEKALESKGWYVWWDRKIPIGKQFDEVIEEAIDATKCVIVVWTKSSVKSKWVRTEAGEGERRGILIPIQLDDVKIPLAFRRIETAQLINWDGVSEHPELEILFEAIARFVGHIPEAKPEKPVSKKTEDRKLNIEKTTGYVRASTEMEVLFNEQISSIYYHDKKSESSQKNLMITSQGISFPAYSDPKMIVGGYLFKQGTLVVPKNEVKSVKWRRTSPSSMIYINTIDGKRFGFYGITFLQNKRMVALH